jgi:class 3 adenylate cyclase
MLPSEAMNADAIGSAAHVRPRLRVACAQRSVGSALLGTMILTRLVATDAAGPATLAVLTFNVLVWPQIVFRLGARSRAAFGIEPVALLVDAAVAGGWEAWMGFPAWPALAFYTTTVVSSLLGLGGWAAGRALLAGGLGIVGVVALHGFTLHPMAGTATNTLAVSAVLAYVTLIAAVAHYRSEALRESRRLSDRQRTRQEQLTTRLARYLSPQVITAILDDDAPRDRVGSRRRFLTVFFSDIEEFTPLVERMAPEDLTRFVNDYIEEMAGIAHAHGGTVDRYVGDAILVFFGDPGSAGPDRDAIACVEMAAAMQRRLRDLRPDWVRRYGVALNVRMGIDSGWCTAGDFGSDLRLQYTAIGMPVNVASRLQGVADPGGVLLSAATYTLVRHAIRCEPGGYRALKGVEEPVAVFALSTKRVGEAGERTENPALDLDLGA